MFCQYLIPAAIYFWESTILCAGSQHCLTGKMHRFNTYSKYVTVRLLSLHVDVKMVSGKPAIKPNHEIWVQGVATGSGCLQCCRAFCLLHYTYLSKLCDISETLCYLGILRRDSNSQNLPLEKLYCLHEPWLLVNSRIHILGFLFLFPRQPLQVPPELLLLCSLIKMYMLPLADLIYVNSINFRRYDID